MANFDITHLDQARKQLRKERLKAYLIVTGDPHHSEEPASYFGSERRYFCPFSGDNAFVLLTRDGSYLWTDGRFFLSAEKELEGSTFALMKMDTPGYPSLLEFLKEKSLYPLGTDFNLMSPRFLQDLAKAGRVKDTSFAHLIADRPLFPEGKIWRFDDPAYNDLTREEKLEQVRAAIKEAGARAHLITTLDDIAYLTNLRGDDIPYTPVFYAYLYIDMEEAALFVNKDKLDFEIPSLQVYGYEEIDAFLSARADIPTLVDTDKANAHVVRLLSNVIAGPMPSRMMKAIKGSKEIENIRMSQITDGIALLKFIDFLDSHKQQRLSEWAYAEALAKFRREGENFLGESFPTIAAAGPNAAMMHYLPSQEENSLVDPKETIALLVDSGGHYLCGTTDTTRTFPIGELTEEFKRDYTSTLASVIALSQAVFIRGASGRCLDMAAREVMWRRHMDYKCGTGHGVGYVSVVHEAPNGFRYRAAMGKDDDAPILPGMVTTVEPGVYKQGKYGIRIENNLLTVADKTTVDGEFFKFENLTFVPIDLSAVLFGELAPSDIDWINLYHHKVYRALAPHLSGHLLEVLKKKTAWRAGGSLAEAAIEERRPD